jgi:MobA/MobL family
MATFYLRTRTGLASKREGRKHALYIAGKDRYSDKTEVHFVVDKNLPVWAKNADEFFVQADDNERANGRSYRSVVFAIPNEAIDKCQWAQEFAQTLLGNKHAYRLAVHIPQKQHNPHAHLMFTERGQADMPAETYFGRKNTKERAFSGSKSKQWLDSAKRQYLALIRRLCPDYTPPNRGEPKIGQFLQNASPVYDEKRQERIAEVALLRTDERELEAVNTSLAEFHEVLPDDSFMSAMFEQMPSNCIEFNHQKFTPSSRSVLKGIARSQPSQNSASRPKFK